MQIEKLSEQTTNILQALQAIPEIWEHLNYVITQDDNGLEHIVMWSKS